VKVSATLAVGWFIKPSADIAVARIIIAVNRARQRTDRLAVLRVHGNSVPTLADHCANALSAVSPSSQSETMHNSVRVLADRRLIVTALRLTNCLFKMTIHYP
jgi:hypothetical protein